MKLTMHANSPQSADVVFKKLEDEATVLGRGGFAAFALLAGALIAELGPERAVEWFTELAAAQRTVSASLHG